MSSAPSPPLMLSHWLSLVNVVSSSNYMTSVLEIRWPFCRILRHKFSSGCSFFQQPSQLYWRPERKSQSLVPSTQSRPADIYLTCWKRGRPAALDVTVISTLQQSTVRGAAEDQGHAVLVAEERKFASHGTACQAVASLSSWFPFTCQEQTSRSMLQCLLGPTSLSVVTLCFC